ncbi:peptidoglycan D,D-transpeptidase FtsI family protein [Alkalicoccus urumqiensis]|uniref:serine-type D-Ala-D-Ala carboxypeptidase n=1 Tax=Alkalicoccus urumqiensis TaxID=1548213 RepID=A0A2P6MFR7_ALKUR|nr:penicillin-binding protein 2 [Alkalicoccus urumqiensis]PRO65142.1 penicillin-binding protein 2 [Alkalicoccus urumqiensis]
MADKTIHKTHVTTRLNILFFVVFLLFSILILRLGIVQIVQGEEFEEQLAEDQDISEPVEAPRGMMYDRYGNLLVGNELILTLTYTNRNRSQEDLLETAEKLNEFITIDPEEAEGRYERDWREYWALLNPEEFEEKLTVAEQTEAEISDADAHTERIEAVTESELASFTQEEREVFMIWREINRGYNDIPHKVVRDVTYDQAAQIMERVDDLPGVDIVRDSERRYVYGDAYRSIFGGVGSIARDDIDQFLARGYERNAEVGQSYLEAQYEDVLRGQSGEIRNRLNEDGEPLSQPELEPGQRGYDLKLTFDMELHQRVKDIIETEVQSRAGSFIDQQDAYVVIMEPDTGDILTLAGNNSDLGTFTQGYVVGSSMKGATVLAGYDTGVLPPGAGIYDRPINFPGSQPISSVSTLGYVDDITALERSSNVYMVEVAMRLVDYVPGVSGTNWGNYKRGFDILRSYYQQFGLGVETGIDLPNEFTGINGGRPDYPGSMLFLSFGQFDTYTPLQLAQYVATIANDGQRIAPRVVSEILYPDTDMEELGSVEQQFKPEILNVIDVDQTYFDRIQQGFYRVVNGDRGTARSYFDDVEATMAGKTGTAQVTVNGVDGNNQTFVGYAPYEDPEVVISVIVPGVTTADGSTGFANTIAERSMEAYFDLKESRNGPQPAPEEEQIEEETEE